MVFRIRGSLIRIFRSYQLFPRMIPEPGKYGVNQGNLFRKKNSVPEIIWIPIFPVWRRAPGIALSFVCDQPHRIEHGSTCNEEYNCMEKVRDWLGKDPEDIKEHKKCKRNRDEPAVLLPVPGGNDNADDRNCTFDQDRKGLEKFRSLHTDLIVPFSYLSVWRPDRDRDPKSRTRPRVFYGTAGGILRHGRRLMPAGSGS